jgi:hypothetical protein
MIAALVLALALPAGAQDALGAARDLYASAAYEDALDVLNKVPSEPSRPFEEARTISQYRAFCLLALGRTGEAERVIEAIVSRDPMFHPATDEASPRVRAAFSDVRRRLLPAIVQQVYGEAKAAYDRKEYEAAAASFAHVLDVMSDPDIGPTATQPPLSDLRTLAAGFRELAVIAATPPPLPASEIPEPAAPAPPRIYTVGDTEVVPPQVLRQELPPYPGHLITGRHGVLDVVIDETGAVEAVTMRQGVNPAYDAVAVRAAQGWRYMPAMLNGKPVKFRKLIQVTLTPRS